MVSRIEKKIVGGKVIIDTKKGIDRRKNKSQIGGSYGTGSIEITDTRKEIVAVSFSRIFCNKFLIR